MPGSSRLRGDVDMGHLFTRTVLPLILGAGPRLDSKGGPGESLEPLEAQSLPSGFVPLRYRRR